MDQAEVASNDNLAVLLLSNRPYLYGVAWEQAALGPGAHIETVVQTSVRVKPRDAVAVLSIDDRKRASDKNLPVGLHGDTPDKRSVCSRARIETRIAGSVRLE